MQPLCVSLKKDSTNVEKNVEKYIIFEGRKINILTDNEIYNIMEDKMEFIKSFEDFINENSNSSNDIWKTIHEISNITETQSDDTIRYVESFYEFVKNSEGKYTTRKEYDNKTPNWKKIIHSLRHKI